MPSLPPTMTKADLVAWILAEAEEHRGLTKDERELVQPMMETLVDELFASRANPRTIITPQAITLVKHAFAHMQSQVGPWGPERFGIGASGG